MDEIKTRKMRQTLDNLKVSKALVVTSNGETNTVLSVRNLRGVKAASPNTINVYDILKYNTVVASKAAVNTIEEVYV